VEKHIMGGSKMLSHCTVFQGCPCLNSNHGNIGAYFILLMVFLWLLMVILLVAIGGYFKLYYDYW
jgi:hypothetical protein